MINYAEYIKVWRFRILTWILPGFTQMFIREGHLKHLCGPIFYEL